MNRRIISNYGNEEIAEILSIIIPELEVQVRETGVYFTDNQEATVVSTTQEVEEILDEEGLNFRIVDCWE